MKRDARRLLKVAEETGADALIRRMAFVMLDISGYDLAVQYLRKAQEKRREAEGHKWMR